MENKNNERINSESKILHLTDSDLDIESRNKPFEQITIKDFNLSITDASKALYVFFVDTRNRRKLINMWKRILRINYGYENKVKQLIF
ncbi:MAG: hypothetical protein Q8880_00665 [Bacteroidota bacterium]|nr:hypothetical protein [Bacteroidota bacterium]